MINRFGSEATMLPQAYKDIKRLPGKEECYLSFQTDFTSVN